MTLSETDGENFTAVIKHVWKCPKMTSSSLQVFNEQYFLVTMDDLCGIEESEGAGRSYLCHRDSPGIFPAQWSLKNGLPLSPPPGLLCQMLYFISCGWYQNIINNKLDHLCFFPFYPWLYLLLSFCPFCLYFIMYRIPGSRLWLGRLPETVWGRGSSSALLPNCKATSVFQVYTGQVSL